MGVFVGLRDAAIYGLAIAAITAPAAWAQQPMPPEAAEISHCLCLQQAMSALSAEMSEKDNALAGARQRLDDLTRQVASARGQVDVNNPEEVARFKELLAQRDAAFKTANGALVAAARVAVQRYNGRVNEYNETCANRPQDPVLVSQVRATLSCPPLY